MSPLAALKRFFNSSVEGHAPIDDPFIQIDRDGICKSLKLVERGEEQGKLNQPSETSTDYDVVENDIISHVGSLLNDAQINARNQVQSYETRLSHLQLLHEVGEIKAAALKASGDFETLVIDWQNRLSVRRDSIRESYFDLKKFKSENQLSRPAVEVPSKIVSFGSIALAALAEVFGNAIFLSEHDENGYLGGIFAAILVALVNVGLAVAAGFFVWPRAHLRNAFDERIAWLGISLWLAVMLVWNLLAAHYRDAKSSDLPNPPEAAMTLLTSQPLVLSGIYSWGILLIGIIAALVAARSAYRMEDPFPGYGERSRQHEQRCEDYAAAVADANRELTGVRDDAINDATEAKAQLGKQLRERHRIEAAYVRFAKRYEQHQDRLEETMNYILSVYRNANRQHRNTTDPLHFARRYMLSRDVTDPPFFAPIRERDIEQSEASLSGCIEDVSKEFSVAIRKLEPLDRLKAELSHGTL